MRPGTRRAPPTRRGPATGGGPRPPSPSPAPCDRRPDPGRASARARRPTAAPQPWPSARGSDDGALGPRRRRPAPRDRPPASARPGTMTPAVPGEPDGERRKMKEAGAGPSPRRGGGRRARRPRGKLARASRERENGKSRSLPGPRVAGHRVRSAAAQRPSAPTGRGRPGLSGRRRRTHGHRRRGVPPDGRPVERTTLPRPTEPKLSGDRVILYYTHTHTPDPERRITWLVDR